MLGVGICIRPFRDSDIPEFVHAVCESSNSVGIWMPWCHEGYTDAQAQVWFACCAENIRNGRAYDLGIFSIDEKTLYGGIAINQINAKHRYGVIGYWVRESKQRRGIATQAVRLISSFGFDELKLSRLEIPIAEANHASQGVAEKAGAAYEGIARNRLVIRDYPIHAAIYSLTPVSIR